MPINQETLSLHVECSHMDFGAIGGELEPQECGGICKRWKTSVREARQPTIWWYKTETQVDLSGL